MIEVDDDYADEITVNNLAQSYASILDMSKNVAGWHEDDIEAWEELLPALFTVGKWYSTDFAKEIKKAKKRMK